MPRWLRRLLLLLGAALLVALLVQGFRPRPPLVDVAAVARGALQVTIEEEGRARVRDRYVVSAPVPGFQHRLAVRVGDAVEEGQVVAVIEPLRAAALDPRARAEAQARVAAARAALQQAEASVRAAEADAELAEAEVQRVRRLHEQGATTRARLDEAEARARATAAAGRSAEFAVEVARHQLEAARATLAYTTEPADQAGTVEVRAPVRGRVLRVARESEGVVLAGAAILEVGDPAALEVEVDVLSSDAVRLTPGGRVVLERWGGAPLEARVRRVEPVGFTKVSALGVEEQRVLTILDIVSPPAEWERLGDGYRVEAVFVLWEAPDVLQVPQAALFLDPTGAWHAFAVGPDDLVERRRVEVGQRTGLEAQVLDGLREGERVVTHPPEALEDGGRVRARG
ncbi:MAG: efflux RND transporter periplasmic adaptor subunit [Planctomycetes bacterium]|nr:efflux RND transporter periplasmic adaptor subunit [Planctomycetota bacterium]